MSSRWSAARGRAWLGAAAAVAAMAAAAPAAQAAGSPTATTGGAQNVTYSAAKLTGAVNPNGGETSYYFQYGVTHLYGSQSGIANAGSGTHTLTVGLPVSGLAPLTLYHYRLVAVNAAGVTLGGDRTFVTPKVPLSLAIVATPDPVPYGGTAVVQGTLSGTLNANRTVVLEADPFGSAAGFLPVGNPQLTSATGGFAFPVLGLTAQTQFRVVTDSPSPVVSPVVVENVAVIVTSHVGRSRLPHHVRVFGTVTPAENGMHVAILREVHGHGVLAGGAVLRADGPAHSSFSRPIFARRGVYRVLVIVTGTGQSSAYGQPLLVR